MDDDISDRVKAAKRTSPYLTAQQAAFYLGLSINSLKRLRSKGEGPIYRRHSRFVQYHIDDLEAWSAARSRGNRT